MADPAEIFRGFTARRQLSFTEDRDTPATPTRVHSKMQPSAAHSSSSSELSVQDWYPCLASTNPFYPINPIPPAPPIPATPFNNPWNPPPVNPAPNLSPNNPFYNHTPHRPPSTPNSNTELAGAILLLARTLANPQPAPTPAPVPMFRERNNVRDPDQFNASDSSKL